MVHRSDEETMQRVCYKYPMHYWTIEYICWNFPKIRNTKSFNSIKQTKDKSDAGEKKMH